MQAKKNSCSTCKYWNLLKLPSDYKKSGICEKIHSRILKFPLRTIEGVIIEPEAHIAASDDSAKLVTSADFFCSNFF